MKKKIISGLVIIIMAIIANYPIYKDLQKSAKVAQKAIKSMDTILIAVQSEIISWEEKVFLLQEHINVLEGSIDSLTIQAKEQVNQTIESKKEELKSIIPGLDNIKF
jgi:TolA-binding protein